MQIECASESIIVHISTEGNTDFHGLVYPRGLSKNSSCLQEYKSQPAPITYNLPLRSCNTMPTELVSFSHHYSLLFESMNQYSECVLSHPNFFIFSMFISRPFLFLLTIIFASRVYIDGGAKSRANQLGYYPLS